jgi:hypothetical protein
MGHHAGMADNPRPGLAAVLAKPAYRRLFVAQTTSRWGDTFSTVALNAVLAAGRSVHGRASVLQYPD